MYRVTVREHDETTTSFNDSFNHVWQAWDFIASEIEAEWDEIKAPDFVSFHEANRAWGDCHERALLSTETGDLETPNGLVFSVVEAD